MIPKDVACAVVASTWEMARTVELVVATFIEGSVAILNLNIIA